MKKNHCQDKQIKVWDIKGRCLSTLSGSQPESAGSDLTSQSMTLQFETLKLCGKLSKPFSGTWYWRVLDGFSIAV